MKKIRSIISIASVLIVLFMSHACSKEPGTGGTSSISGKVYIKDYNAFFTVLYREYYAPEQRVYLVYGDNDVYSQDMRTHYDGTYRFDNLRKGKYQVYAYSKDSTLTAVSGIVPVIKTVEITKNNQHIVLDDIIIFD